MRVCVCVCVCALARARAALCAPLPCITSCSAGCTAPSNTRACPRSSLHPQPPAPPPPIPSSAHSPTPIPILLHPPASTVLSTQFHPTVLHTPNRPPPSNDPPSPLPRTTLSLCATPSSYTQLRTNAHNFDGGDGIMRRDDALVSPNTALVTHKSPSYQSVVI
eukprot:3609401-Prymnesium_polylepis.1